MAIRPIVEVPDPRLREISKPAVQLAEQAQETHLLMNNCYRDYAVRNADELRDLLARYGGD